MAKHLPFTGLILLATLNSGQAVARCDSTAPWSQVQDLVATLTNNGAVLGMTACSIAGQEPTAQEEHHYGGSYPPATDPVTDELWDYKCGNVAGTPTATCPKPAVDPRRKLGTWSVEDDGTTGAAVTYHYDAFGDDTEGPYKVYTDGFFYDFCDGPTPKGRFTLMPTAPGGATRVCP